MRPATISEIRIHFAAINYKVRISRDGSVEYRPPGVRHWLCGRHVTEYVITNDGVRVS